MCVDYIAIGYQVSFNLMSLKKEFLYGYLLSASSWDEHFTVTTM